MVEFLEFTVSLLTTLICSVGVLYIYYSSKGATTNNNSGRGSLKADAKDECSLGKSEKPQSTSSDISISDEPVHRGVAGVPAEDEGPFADNTGITVDDSGDDDGWVKISSSVRINTDDVVAALASPDTSASKKLSALRQIQNWIDQCREPPHCHTNKVAELHKSIFSNGGLDVLNHLHQYKHPNTLEDVTDGTVEITGDEAAMVEIAGTLLNSISASMWG